jgi:hypothetical protein
MLLKSLGFKPHETQADHVLEKSDLVLVGDLLVTLLSGRAINNRQRLFYLVNGLHQPTGEKRQGPYPPNPLSVLLGLLHAGTCGTRE